MLARIYRPAKSAMQSGLAKTHDWVLEFAPDSARTPNALTGWTQSSDMNGQVRLSFATEAEAIAYAQSHAIPFHLTEPKPAKKNLKAYADNFAVERRFPWTH